MLPGTSGLRPSRAGTIHAARIVLVLALVAPALLTLPGASLGSETGAALAQAPVPRFAWQGSSGFGADVAVAPRDDRGHR